MELSNELYQLIGKYIIDFFKHNDNDFRTKLCETIATEMVLSEDLQSVDKLISFINNRSKKREPFFHLLKDPLIKSKRAFDNCSNLIFKNNLQKYSDIIQKNFRLNINSLINIANEVYAKTKDLEETLNVYIKLGYGGYEWKSLNEKYTLYLITEWADFAVSVGHDKNESILNILNKFYDRDSEEIFIKIKKQLIFDCIYQTDKLDSLIEYILEKEDFNKNLYWLTDENIENQVPLNYEDIPEGEFYYNLSGSEEFIKIDSLSREEKIKELKEMQSLINYRHDEKENPHSFCYAYYFTYLYFKAIDKENSSILLSKAYQKWLTLNLDKISEFLPELHVANLNFIIKDYADYKFKDATPICNEKFCFYPNKQALDIIYDLKEERNITKEELIDFWKYLILETDLYYSNKDLKEIPAWLQLLEQDYPDSGLFEIPWKYVRYVDGKAFFYHPNNEKGRAGKLPYAFNSEFSKASFKELGKRILWCFPPISCYAKDGKIIKIDEQYANHVILKINEISESLSNDRNNPYASLRYIDREVLKKIKSQYLDFLEKKQLKDYPIVSIKEIVTIQSFTSDYYKEEPSYLFSVGESDETITLIYENLEVSRASFVFIIKKDSWRESVKKINEYFTSVKSCKRSELQYSRDMFNMNNGFIKIDRILHDYFYDWCNKINFYSKNL